MATIHGGQLNQVAAQFNIPMDKWLDLSTGIAPFSYPIPDIPQQIWQDLPTIPNSLITAAKHYYQAEYCWPLAGSQNLIEKLPTLWGNKIQLQYGLFEKHVYLPKVGYKEHQQAWDKAGYQLHFYQTDLPHEIELNSVVVVINPNNPLTDSFSIQQLQKLQQHCEQQHALLIIDEAFADIFPTAFSFVAHINPDRLSNTLVLRSIGKFFGLAGLRVGFVCSNQAWFVLIQQSTGPWSVNGPALFVTEQALKDTQWQTEQTRRLQQQSKAMQKVISKYLPIKRIEANALFMTVFLDNAAEMYQQLCQKALYVRLTDEQDALRFGIANERQLIQLKSILSTTN
jgi:cobalamin biosynthetic protein CobC